MLYVTSVAHALHRICETIRMFYPNVDKLAADGKNIFVKSLHTYSAPKSVDYTLGNLVWFRRVLCRNLWSVLFCDTWHWRGDAFSVAIFHEIFIDSDELQVLKTDLFYVHANFSSVFQSISRVGNDHNFFFRKTIRNRWQSRSTGQSERFWSWAIKEEFYSYFNKNKGFQVMYDI
jgi:hypothetical protein